MKVVLAVLTILILGVVITLIIFIKPKQLDRCGDRTEFFTYPLIDIENVSSILPLGTLSPSSHTFPTKHMYWGLKGYGFEADDDNLPGPYTVYAPGDLTITGITSSEYPEEGFTDYSINYAICGEVTGYFIHLTALSDELTQRLDSPISFCSTDSHGGRESTSCSYMVSLKVEAGEIIGSVGRPGQGNFDFGLKDTRVAGIEFANPNRVQNKDDISVCSLDYYTSSVKAQLYELLDSEAIGDARCGTAYQDVAGTLQGIWFVTDGQGDKRDEGPQLALVHHNVDPSSGMISMGTSLESIGVEAGRYEFSPTNSGLINRDFDQTSAGNTYCYDTYVNGYSPGPERHSILIEMVDENTLRIGPAESSPCKSGNTFDGFVEFER